MYAVIFEAKVADNQQAQYLDIAAGLVSELEQIEGFISVERFTSLTEEGKLLSLSFWRDEASVKRWREHGKHREAQGFGRNQIFSDYRLRIADVARDYGKYDRAQAPAHNKS